MIRSQGNSSIASFNSLRLNVRTVSTSTTMLATDYAIRADSSGANLVVNLMPAASCKGQSLAVKKIDASANVVTIDPAGTETIDGALTMGLSSQWQALEIQSNGVSWDVLSIG